MNPLRVTINREFLVEVVRGNVEGYSTVHKFGAGNGAIADVSVEFELLLVQDGY